MKGASAGLVAVIVAGIIAALYFLTRKPVPLPGAAPVATPKPPAPTSGLAQDLTAGAALVSAIGGLWNNGSTTGDYTPAWELH